ncbi:MAG: dTDP-4-amino-4,6-dideoxygalactose transaminase [Clostridiales Family XIII bacterium]|jgi:dTDP-4-amino-4,6-dideoxygalactose transaminase|nr:dTDP-4-amino-4,6-dideoxygalactose transaminase [Clostridiales Family XIII bacterium]
MTIRFFKPPVGPNSVKYALETLETGNTPGDNPFTFRVNDWFKEKIGMHATYVVTSGTHALELACFALDVKPGDEVIMPSFTFAATANAVAIRGGICVFVDIRPDTMNIDENLIEAAITDKTVGIIPIDYAGIPAEMDTINAIAKKHGLWVVVDAAQSLMSTYKGRPVGSLADMSCISFHGTKNFSMGEGGALTIADEKHAFTAERIRENGTNRQRYIRGELDKYTWDAVGSSYLGSDTAAANLFGQLEVADEITQNRVDAWNYYAEKLKPLEDKGLIELQKIPEYATGNGHIFYFKTNDVDTRTELLYQMQEAKIGAMSHYVPLHSCPAAKEHARFVGEDKYTTTESEKLVRLPIYYQISKEDLDTVIAKVYEFYEGK